MNTELIGFIREAISKGVSRKEIKDALHKAGWHDDEVKTSLDFFADVDFPVPVPRRKPYLSAREAFMYLVLFFTLYISAFSFGTSLFQFINRALPDPIQSVYIIEETAQKIRWSTSAMVIAFPVYLFMSWLLTKAVKKDPDKRSSKVRKWLTYITLFITAGILIGDLITLVYNFLGGELTTRFVLKVIVVAAVAGSVFAYYLWDLYTEEKEV
ncbi:hypothetical protein KKF59_02060 [Patescibacteria group bacterium]|nr:hypothetical protein [Patescibacteria group bacterium]MBU1035046.1 hypothetical protein [Patescibacteria group bacterium]MBU1630086.1 hypothetical protein [Patescibacteria group bacterium]MBU1907894.1 hypothetical protein [Patescibacteria group bacterium]